MCSRSRMRARAEPLTNGITIPFAFLPGPILFGIHLGWEFSFFIYPIVIAVVNGLAKRQVK